MCALGGLIYRLHCKSSTKVCPLGGLNIQVPLYINYYSVSLGWFLYTGFTVHQLLRCAPWVVLIYRFHCTLTTTVCLLHGWLNIQVTLYINYFNTSLGWSLFKDSTVHQLLQCVPWLVFIYRFHCIYHNSELSDFPTNSSNPTLSCGITSKH